MLPDEVALVVAGRGGREGGRRAVRADRAERAGVALDLLVGDGVGPVRRAVARRVRAFIASEITDDV